MTDDFESRLQELLEERARLEQGSVDRVLGSIDALPDRHRRLKSRFPLLAAAAAILLGTVVLGVAALLRDPADVATPVSPSSPTISADPSSAAISPSLAPSVSVTPQSRPVWAIDLASQLDCDGALADLGNEVPPVPGPFDPAPTPDGALDNIRITYQNLPASGFEPVLVEGHWALHRYLVDGRAKVLVVSTNQFPDVDSETRWEVVGLRACDRSEFAEADFDPEANTIWLDAAGDPVRTDVITSSAGPGHCGWQRTVFLSLFDPDYTQYFRDPHADLAEYSVVQFDADARLPDDATDTGLHTDDWHLFTIPSGRAVFMRTPDGTIERWPRANQPVGCM